MEGTRAEERRLYVGEEMRKERKSTRGREMEGGKNSIFLFLLAEQLPSQHLHLESSLEKIRRHGGRPVSISDAGPAADLVGISANGG